MAGFLRLKPPLSDAETGRLKAGDLVLLSGILYTARDAAHMRLVGLIREGKDLPIDIRGQIIYYAGPSPARPGNPIGSVGPTTSNRMDAYSPILMEHGLKGMIGKGSRSQEVIEAMVRWKAVYFAATGGAAALLARRVTSSQVVAYEELGPEAIRRLTVEDFPVVVVNDTVGNDLYRQGVEKYAVK